MEVELTEDGVVVLDFKDLLESKDLSKSIETAFGYSGIGLLVVKNVPKFSEYRDALLPLGPQYASLPTPVLDKSVHKASNYSFGWSHGKEILRPGLFDEFKGSYYNNPQYDDPFKGEDDLIKKYPEACHPNIWPIEDFPALRPAFMNLGQLIVDVGLLVAMQCDRYVASKFPGYPANQLADVIKNSRTCKARLLQYFAINEDQTERTHDSWCGWHNDHSALTGLCPAMYHSMDGKTVVKSDIPCPDPKAGLWVRKRDGNEMKVNVPKNYIAFQIGECSQVLTGGLLRATPHAVQAIKYPESVNVSRSTYATFMQPNQDFVLRLPPGLDVTHAQVGQYKENMTFAEFHKATIDNFYTER
eukprot:TRINITY_DN2025_c0_g1_i1.p1 TRINITY_DN2025_c0_g1~~TRINITY_DN2025_c0_g1_i1.p1  ORF type:complete len:358 (+),score=72.30 TRINITY_DN2025_c0_g1_i1:111-1184(+)